MSRIMDLLHALERLESRDHFVLSCQIRPPSVRAEFAVTGEHADQHGSEDHKDHFKEKHK